ncbi:MAG: MHYT domain-containing protein [Candidatus Sulfotelmatobacter sp.]
MNGTIPILGSYDYRLVGLSVVIAIVASYAALDLAGRVTANQGRARLGWLLGGAFAMGSGIWAMHYTGMLAFRLPIQVYYHAPTVAFSLLAAVLASLVALYVVSREPMTPLHVAAGSLFMGIGIATMHYTGMAAMRMAAMHSYHRGLWTLSVILAVIISLVGLQLIFFSRDENRGGMTKFAIAIILGLAIPVMHYTGMAAVSFARGGPSPDLSYSVDISALANSAIIVVIFVILAFVVITSLVDRRLSAQQSKLNDERNILRTLIDNIPDFMFVKDTQGKFLITNAYTARILGANSVEELLGKTVFDLFPNELAAGYAADDQEVMRSGRPLFNREENGVDREGNTTHLLTTKVPLRAANGAVSGIAGVARDISNRKRGEDALRAAHQRAEVFINAVPSILIGVDRESRITRWNSAAAASFGLSETDVVGKQLADCGVKWQQAGMSTEIRSWCSEQTSRRCDRIPFEMNGETRLLGLTITSINVADENLTELLVIGSDITDRTALEDQLRQALKLESVGQLAAGIAHEINTPTQYIGDNVRFLKEAFQDLKNLLVQYERLLPAAKGNAMSSETVQAVATEVEQIDAAYLLEEIPKAIEQTLEGINRVSTLVSAMKEFSHPGTKEKILLDLNHAIQSTITVARNEWKYVADMETDFDPALPLISCQPGEFNQVILNLIVNAAHAIADAVAKGGSEKGTIRIRTRNCRECAEIRIQDSGTGIPEKVRPRIFDPFFTTKEIGKGTGQGLAIARSVVVDKHNGTIHFETEEGKGTTFIIRLPHEARPLATKAVSA